MKPKKRAEDLFPRKNPMREKLSFCCREVLTPKHVTKITNRSFGGFDET